MNQNSNQLQRIGLPTARGLLFLQPDSIVYIQPDERQSIVHTTSMQEPVRILASLAELEKKLEPYPCFFRTHRTCIVNLLHVDHLYDKELKMSTSLGEIPISRDNIKRLKSLFCAEN